MPARQRDGPDAWKLADAEIHVPGLADPLELASARAQIDGARVVLDRVEAQAGKLAFTGEYRYEPGTARPHRLRLRAAEVDAADLEPNSLPTLRAQRRPDRAGPGPRLASGLAEAARRGWHRADR